MNNQRWVFRVLLPWPWVAVVVLCSMYFGWLAGTAAFAAGARWEVE